MSISSGWAFPSTVCVCVRVMIGTCVFCERAMSTVMGLNHACMVLRQPEYSMDTHVHTCLHMWAHMYTCMQEHTGAQTHPTPPASCTNKQGHSIAQHPHLNPSRKQQQIMTHTDTTRHHTEGCLTQLDKFLTI